MSSSSVADVNDMGQDLLKSNKTVEFYDYSSRYHCKMLGDSFDLVEKIEKNNQVSVMKKSNSVLNNIKSEIKTGNCSYKAGSIIKCIKTLSNTCVNFSF